MSRGESYWLKPHATISRSIPPTISLTGVRITAASRCDWSSLTRSSMMLGTKNRRTWSHFVATWLVQLSSNSAADLSLSLCSVEHEVLERQDSRITHWYKYGSFCNSQMIRVLNEIHLKKVLPTESPCLHLCVTAIPIQPFCCCFWENR